MLGLHRDAVSAQRLLEDYRRLAPWMIEAREAWGAVLRPFRHKGTANYLNRTPGTAVRSDYPSGRANRRCAVCVDYHFRLAGKSGTRHESGA